MALNRSNVVIAYSAMEDAELADYASQIHRENDDIELIIERTSSADLRRRILDEGVSGRWDVLFGWSLTYVLNAEIYPLLAPIENIEFKSLPRFAYASDRKWFSPSAFVPAFCVDMNRLARRGLPAPRSWAELAAPHYQGEVVLPNPGKSGAGFLHLSALVQKEGIHRAREILVDIAKGRPKIVESANAPCLAVANGEAAIGVSVSTSVNAMINRGVDVKLIIPEDARAFEMEGFAVREGSSNKRFAERALQWTLSNAANASYRRYGKVALAQPTANAPPEESQFSDLGSIDTVAAAASRCAVCAEWDAIFFQPL